MDKESPLVKYFIEQTNEKFSELKIELALMRSEIHSLNTFRWKSVGVVSALIILAEIGHLIYGSSNG